MNIQEKNTALKEHIKELDKKENELKGKIAEFKSLIIEKERKEKRLQELLKEEQELLAKL